MVIYLFQVKNGTLDSKAIGLEEDRALFCADESGRILHIDSTSVRLACEKVRQACKSLLRGNIEVNPEVSSEKTKHLCNSEARK